MPVMHRPLPACCVSRSERSSTSSCFLVDMTDRLYEVDLAIVKNELWPLRNLWRGIGENLGIKPHDLEEIAEIERRIPGNCFGSMLLKWLRRKSTPDHPITWEGLVMALQVGQLKDECGAVVEKIVRKFDIVQPLLIPPDTSLTAHGASGLSSATVGHKNVDLSLTLSLDVFAIYLKKKGLGKRKDQEKIRDDGISPQVLLEMSESEIDRQGFSYGGAKVLKKTLNELKKSKQVSVDVQDKSIHSEEVPVTGTAKIVDSDVASLELRDSVAEQEPVVKDLPWCIDAPLRWQEILPEYHGDSASIGALSNTSRKSLLWMRKKNSAEFELHVKFLNLIPRSWTYCGQSFDCDSIISWASVWNRRGNVIPKLIKVEGSTPAEIRVKFTEDGFSHSFIGVEALDIRGSGPTMWLNLSAGGDNYKKYVVVHQFGHALGLEHEHQCGEFWRLIKDYIDVSKMRKDRLLQGFDAWFEGLQYFSSEHDTSQYDPSSIMQYWCKAEWLKDEYSDEIKVEQDTALTLEVKNAILSIHQRSKGNLVVQPSQLDYDFLEAFYQANSNEWDDNVSELSEASEVAHQVKMLKLTRTEYYHPVPKDLKSGNMVQFLHDIILQKLREYLEKRKIKRKSKQDMKTLEIDMSSIEELVRNSEFDSDAHGIRYSNYVCMNTSENVAPRETVQILSPTDIHKVSSCTSCSSCEETPTQALQRLIKSSTKPRHEETETSAGHRLREHKQKGGLKDWGQVVWCKCAIENLPWRFDSNEKIRFRMSPDEKWNNTVFKTPTMILVATLFSNAETVEKRSDSLVKRVIKDKEIDVKVVVSGNNYQYPVISTQSNN